MGGRFASDTVFCQSSEHVVMSGLLGTVVERFQSKGSIMLCQGSLKQIIAECRVLGQHRPMAVGTEDILVMCALSLIFSVVAEADLYLRKGRHGAAEPGFAAVIFKADHGTAAAIRHAAEDGVADHTGLGADGIEIQSADKIAADPIVGLIVLSKHLIAAADGEDGETILNGRPDFTVLAALQIRQKYFLLEILTSADKQEIKIAQMQDVTDHDTGNLRVNAAPLQTLLHADDVSAVSVQVQYVRIEMTDSQFHVLLYSLLLFPEFGTAAAVDDDGPQVEHGGIGRQDINGQSFF